MTWLKIPCATENWSLDINGPGVLENAHKRTFSVHPGLCSLDLFATLCPLDPQAEFFYIYGWLIKIHGCFSAKPENCGEGIFRLKTSAVYQIYG